MVLGTFIWPMLKSYAADAVRVAMKNSTPHKRMTWRLTGKRSGECVDSARLSCTIWICIARRLYALDFCC